MHIMLTFEEMNECVRKKKYIIFIGNYDEICVTSKKLVFILNKMCRKIMSIRPTHIARSFWCFILFNNIFSNSQLKK